MKKIRVLIVDDSALVRQILSDGLSKDENLEVVGSATDPYMARDMIVKLRPDVLTLDVEMPKMDGVEFLRKLMPQYPLPVVMVSSLTQKGKQVTLDALDAGAVDFVTKPTANLKDGLNSLIMELRTKVKIASTANVSHWKNKPVPMSRPSIQSSAALSETTLKVIAIGASTGGTEAIKKVIDMFPRTSPGVVIVQHMPAGFTKLYADRLNQSCQMEVVEAQDGDRVVPGKVLIAPGGFHMTVRRVGGEYIVDCKAGDKVNGHCPSVSVLFDSVAKHVGANAVGVILTGMGGDGADGMKVMRDAGSFNIAQDEKTSVIFGMPKVAIDKGGVNEILPLDKIPERVFLYLKGKNG